MTDPDTIIFPIPAQPFEYPSAHEYGYHHGRQLAHFLVDVTACSREALAAALAIPFADIVSGELRATHALVHPRYGLVLFKSGPDQGVALDEPLSHASAVDAVWAWLRRCPYARDEHDGAARPGFRVYNERFGIIAEWWGAFVAILPTWIYIPK